MTAKRSEQHYRWAAVELLAEDIYICVICDIDWWTRPSLWKPARPVTTRISNKWTGRAYKVWPGPTWNEILRHTAEQRWEMQVALSVCLSVSLSLSLSLCVCVSWTLAQCADWRRHIKHCCRQDLYAAVLRQVHRFWLALYLRLKYTYWLERLLSRQNGYS